MPPPEPRKRAEPKPEPEKEPESPPAPSPEPEQEPPAVENQARMQQQVSDGASRAVEVPLERTGGVPSVPESSQADPPAPELDPSISTQGKDERIESSTSLRISGSWRERAKDLLPVQHSSGILPSVADASSPGQTVLTEMSLNNSLLDSPPTQRPETKITTTTTKMTTSNAPSSAKARPSRPSKARNIHGVTGGRGARVAKANTERQSSTTNGTNNGDDDSDELWGTSLYQPSWGPAGGTSLFHVF